MQQVDFSQCLSIFFIFALFREWNQKKGTGDCYSPYSLSVCIAVQESSPTAVTKFTYMRKNSMCLQG